MSHSPLLTALERRQPLLDGKTDSLRLCDGEGDGYSLRDIFLDRFGPHLILSTRHDHLLSESIHKQLAATGAHVSWKKLSNDAKTAPSPLFGDPIVDPFTIVENGLQYQIDFTSGYSQGLFLDQRHNRARVNLLAGPSQRILNTFAYTGAFSVSAAAAGATTTTLDLSQPYLDWAKENFLCNTLDPEEHYFCKGDTFHWLKRFARQKRTFDGIILDPPTFSRDDKGKPFSVERDYHLLVKLATDCLTEEGWILASTNCRRLTESALRKQLRPSIPHSHHIVSTSMPPDFTGEPYLKSFWILPRDSRLPPFEKGKLA